MTAAAQLLAIPEVRAHFSPIPVAQYRQYPERNENGRRTELVRGNVIEKLSKSPLHASIAKLLYDGFHAAVPQGLSVRQDQPLTLQDSEPEPDIAIVRGSLNDYRAVHPTSAALVVEIAIHSISLDQQKAGLYAEAGVEEYWIIIPGEKRIEVYTRPQNGAYLERVSVEAGNVVCRSVPGIRVNLQELF